MMRTLALILLFSIATVALNPAQAAPAGALPPEIDKSITEQNVSTAIKELKKDADNLKLRLKQLEASLPKEQKRSRSTAAANQDE